MNIKMELVYGFAAGLAVGGAAGYFLTKMRLQKVYADQADKDIASVKERYTILRKEGEYATPVSAVAAYEAKLVGLEYAEGYSEDAPEDDHPFDRFTSNSNPKLKLRALDPEEDDEEVEEDDAPEAESEEDDAPETEAEPRDTSKPYLISVAEYMEDEPHDEKLSLTYFSEDDTLIDSRESVVPDIIGTIGEEALTMFGHLSDDPSIVYVRNERLEADFEIVLDKRAFTDVVLGLREYEKGYRKFVKEE